MGRLGHLDHALDVLDHQLGPLLAQQGGDLHGNRLAGQFVLGVGIVGVVELEREGRDLVLARQERLQPVLIGRHDVVLVHRASRPGCPSPRCRSSPAPCPPWASASCTPAGSVASKLQQDRVGDASSWSCPAGHGPSQAPARRPCPPRTGPSPRSFGSFPQPAQHQQAGPPQTSTLSRPARGHRGRASLSDGVRAGAVGASSPEPFGLTLPP